jgi:RNA polymerase sigma factor (sigma-70 family)
MDSNYADFIVRCLVEHLLLPLDAQQTLKTLKFHARHLPSSTQEDFGSIVLLECSQGDAIDDREFRRICDRIAHRLAYRAKKASRISSTDASCIDPLKGEQTTLEEDRADSREAIQHALTLVEPNERIMLQFRYIDEMTLKEIGERLGMTISQVRTTLTRTLAKLRASSRYDVE